MVWSLLTAFVGVYSLAGAQVGMLLPRLQISSPAIRLLTVVCAAGLFWPSGPSDILALCVLAGIHIWAAKRSGVEATRPDVKASE